MSPSRFPHRTLPALLTCLLAAGAAQAGVELTIVQHPPLVESGDICPIRLLAAGSTEALACEVLITDATTGARVDLDLAPLPKGGFSFRAPQVGQGRQGLKLRIRVAAMTERDVRAQTELWVRRPGSSAAAALCELL